ncbi:Regulator of G-protein signaling rgs-2 [Trichinella papuae]|uniref:Regulator of G-protein signaling rgs-2 n=1 Tax=Trichinella papuae TaxID=268474 RepID=A0A0V1MXI9_9BILA|nr:Regulator of G-protein signaling rgs-2 [Trichinella papuae]
MFSDGSTKLSVTSNRHDRSPNMYSKEKRSKIFRDRNAKPCCLCWCCCFSCSCLSMQQEQPNVQNSSVPMKQREERPTYEDVKRWSTSFDCLMNHPVGQKMFADFLKSEFSDENILFWQACEDLKKEKNTEKIEEKARIIYEDFVSILSPKEVSLDSRVREIVNSNMVRPNAHTFDEAQAQIFTLMQRDSYPRFIGSEFFKNFTSTFVESES